MSMIDDVAALKARYETLARESERLTREGDALRKSLDTQLAAIRRDLESAASAKPWWTSRGMLGGYGTILGTAALVAGHVLGWPEEAMALLVAATSGSGALSVHGRKHAARPIK